MLTVTVESSANDAILRCRGRIVRGEETAILCAALHERGRNVILDLSRVEALDAAGIGALVALQAAGIYLKLMNPTDHVGEVLRLTKLDSIFEIYKSPASSELTPGGRQPCDQDSGAARASAAI